MIKKISSLRKESHIIWNPRSSEGKEKYQKSKYLGKYFIKSLLFFI